MTLTFLIGGLIAFVLAWRISEAGAASAREAGASRAIFAFVWVAVALAMLIFVFREGNETGNAGNNGVRLAGQTRVAVLEVGVDLNQELAIIRFGGDPKRDDIILDGYPSGTLTFRREDEATVSLGKDEVNGRYLAVFINEERLRDSPMVLPQGDISLAIAVMDEPPNLSLQYNGASEYVRQRYTVVNERFGWQVRFANPEVFYVPGGSIRPASADTSNQARSGSNTTPFVTLGRRFDPSFESTELVLPDPLGRKTLVKGRGQTESFSNAAVRIQQGGVRTILRIDPLNVTAGLRGFSWWAMGFLVIMSFLLSARARVSNPITAAILGMTELLLLIRILMAIEGGMVEETVRSRQALSDALIALPMGLMAVHAAIHERPRRTLIALVAFASGTGIVLYSIVQSNGGVIEPSNWMVLLLGGLCTAFVLALRFGLELVVSIATTLAREAQEKLQATPKIGRVFGKLNSAVSVDFLGSWSRPIFLLICAGVSIIVIKAALLIAFDASERLGIALSIVFIPLTLIAFLPMLLHLLRSHEKPMNGGVFFLLGIAIFVLGTQAVLTPGLAGILRWIGWTEVKVGGDIGLALVLSLALTMTAALIWLVKNARFDWKSWLSAGGLALGLVLCFANWLAGNTYIASWAPPLAIVGISVSLIFIGRSTQRMADFTWLFGISGFAALILVTSVPHLQPKLDSPPSSVSDMESSFRPIIRMTSALAPEKLGFLDSDVARQNREAIEDVAEFGQTEGGYGFLNVPNIGQGVVNQQFSDFAIAVHFVFPFGRIALAGLVLFVGAMGLLVFAEIRSRQGPRLFGVLLGSVFVVTCVYMALANMLLAPVTGRNFYLLAPQSHSDLIEGLLLLATTSLFLAYRTPRKGAIG